ncbi:hypothetical protein INT44_003353 [Umbelopsis vinacea]|uniref:Origin recognition complex subunit 2 n=1 Tax=Umbelopsis vinacea TaxID=44442 RepID=A0A8H7UCB1_9FUNG|nr:hypothetical protein INT44_003353 [Umbelopsis vinacea]
MSELIIQDHDNDEVMEYFINTVHPKAAFRETEVTKTKRLQRGLLGLERKKLYQNAGLTVASTNDTDEIPDLLKQHDDAEQILLHTPNRHNRLQDDNEHTNEEIEETGSGSDKENGATGRNLFGLSKLKGKGVESMMKMAMMATASNKPGRPKKQSFANIVSERLAEAHEAHTVMTSDEEEQKPKRRGRPPKNPVKAEQSTRNKSQRDESTSSHQRFCENEVPQPRPRGRPPKNAIRVEAISKSRNEAEVQQPRRRGRPPKNAVRVENHVSNKPSSDEVEEQLSRITLDAPQPRRRGRPPKNAARVEATAEIPQPRRRGRPPKNAVRVEAATAEHRDLDSDEESENRGSVDEEIEEERIQQPRKRGRPPKNAAKLVETSKRQRDDVATELEMTNSTVFGTAKKKRAIDRQIQLLNEEDEVDSDDDNSEIDQDEENESDDEQEVPKDPLEKDGYERYFQDLHALNKTSNNTLSKLPILDPQEFKTKLAQAPKKHAKDIAILHSLHERQFPQWQFELLSHYNLLFYGYGSKRKLLTKFAQTYLTDGPLIVVNGYFPSITIKDILNKLSIGALGINSPTGSIQDHVSLIMEHFQRGENEYEHIYLLIHNIDGANIRNERAQTALSILASCPNIHIIASIDHINAGLLWDSIKISRFNWIWHDATTFDDYLVETSFENTLMVRQSELGGSRGVNYVLASLTSNARGIFKVLAEHQVMEMELATMEGRGDESVGLTYNAYYTKCREAFFVSNDITFRTQLTEFRDHKIIQSRRTLDGTEIMYLPLDKSTLTNILESIS